MAAPRQKQSRPSVLLVILQQAGLEIPEALRRTDQLSAYAVETRYPGHYEAVTEEDFLVAVQLAETAYRWADSLIPNPSEKDTGGRTPAS